MDRFDEILRNFEKRGHLAKFFIRAMEPKVHFIYGGPGVGKTRLAHEEANRLANARGQRPYLKDNMSRFWPGYDGEAAVVLDGVAPADRLGILREWIHDEHYEIMHAPPGQLNVEAYWLVSNVAPLQLFQEFFPLTTVRRIHEDGSVVWERGRPDLLV